LLANRAIFVADCAEDTVMNSRRPILSIVVILGTLAVAVALLLMLTSQNVEAKGDLASFNAEFREVILKMDNAGVIALWAEDGVSLLPETAPIMGKKNIVGFMDKVFADLSRYRVTKEEIEWRDMRIAGEWASEWGVVHQEVQPPGDKPMIEVYGRIALVLHQDSEGWRIEQEMWQSGPKP
jgi:ketosteroid isomerase-like protein